MTAPALITLAHGSRDPRSAATISALVAETRQMRPDLRIEPAFLELSRPSLGKVVDKLVRAGFEEIVVVPLLLSDAYHARVDVPNAVAEALDRHANLQIRVTDILGLEPTFLDVLDRRLRDALRQARVRELDALVLAAAGSSDPLANQAVGSAGPRLGCAPQAPGHRRVRLGRSPGHRRGRARLPGRGSPPRGGRVDVPGAGIPSRTVPPSSPSRPAPSRSPSPWVPTPSWPARSWPATPWVPSSSSRV